MNRSYLRGVDTKTSINWLLFSDQVDHNLNMLTHQWIGNWLLFFQIKLTTMRLRNRAAAVHSPSESRNTRLSCNQCHLMFPTKSNLKNHIDLVHEFNLYLCPECPKFFSTSSSLRQHTENHPRNATAVRCETCQKIFMNKENLGKHKEKNHTGLESVSCDHCMCTFRWDISLMVNSKQFLW